MLLPRYSERSRSLTTLTTLQGESVCCSCLITLLSDIFIIADIIYLRTELEYFVIKLYCQALVMTFTNSMAYSWPNKHYKQSHFICPGRSLCEHITHTAFMSRKNIED